MNFNDNSGVVVAAVVAVVAVKDHRQ
jgi:hypothetical protein